MPAQIPAGSEVSLISILTAATATIVSAAVPLNSGNKTFQATVVGSGAVTATVVVEVSNDGIGWIADSVSTLSLSGTNVASAGFTNDQPWVFARARVTAISGTGAAITVSIGV